MAEKRTNPAANTHSANEERYRLLIEKTGKDYLRISLQRQAAYW